MIRSVGACVGVVLVAAAGCTSCPDPFDYSGPVPNGSVTQNNFCARSNGILPLNAAPAPWPPVVNDDRDRRVAQPVAEVGEPEAEAEAEATVITTSGTLPSPR